MNNEQHLNILHRDLSMLTKLDLTKPMQTVSGIKVLEYKLFDSLKYNDYPLRVVLENKFELYAYTIDGRYSIYSHHELDLINVYEDKPIWSCPDDVPKRDVIWLRHKNYKVGCKSLMINVNEKGIDIDCLSIFYDQLHEWEWLDNGEWKECRCV